MNLIDLTGRTFGRLTVLYRDVESVSKKPHWICVCSCGATVSVRGTHLSGGQQTACGCRQGFRLGQETKKPVPLTKFKRQGQTKHPLYRTWSSMKMRCSDHAEPQKYELYGRRGIKVCDLWSSDFWAFAEHVGEKPNGHSLDRIDVDGNYEPGNVRWATSSEQALNKRKVTTLQREVEIWRSRAIELGWVDIPPS